MHDKKLHDDIAPVCVLTLRLLVLCDWLSLAAVHRTVRWQSFPAWPLLPDSSLPGRSLPGRSLPGRSLPGRSLPGRSLPGRSPGQVEIVIVRLVSFSCVRMTTRRVYFQGQQLARSGFGYHCYKIPSKNSSS